MFNFNLLKERFPEIESLNDKIRVNSCILEIFRYLKNNAEFDFNMLTSIVAVDLQGSIELIYQLYSTSNSIALNVSLIVDSEAPSVVDIFKSAYFDECEIYDLFGVSFTGNPDLKRLFMPASWVGHPLRKDYKLEDERLVWNE